VAREKLNGSAEVRYFPFDFKSCVRRSLNRINPTAVLVAETEVWPNFIQECVKREVPVFLVNARLSDQSFHRYQQIGFWLGPILQCLHRILAQDEPSATRFRQLGADKSRVDTTGNLKFDILPSADLSAKAAELDQMLGLSQTRVVLAGSTAPAEERILLDAFVSLQPQAANPPIRLVIAPRHPERFDEVQDLLERSCLTWTRRSKPSDHATARSASVVLLDTIGELQAAYSLAEIAFVGGSLVNVGGHNVLEPALFGKPIVVGPYTSNFTSIIQSFRDGAALIQLPHASEAGLRAQLTAELRALLESPSRAHEMGLRAQQLLARNRGATERTLKAIAPFLDRDSSTRQPHQS
jgi:3-deoxy-D-manno-octulosonic-acid transferase